jgi:hypothetical protein
MTAERELWTELHDDPGFRAAWRALLAAWALSPEGRKELT